MDVVTSNDRVKNIQSNDTGNFDRSSGTTTAVTFNIKLEFHHKKRVSCGQLTHKQLKVGQNTQYAIGHLGMNWLTEDETHTLNGSDPKTQFGAQILIWYG